LIVNLRYPMRVLSFLAITIGISILSLYYFSFPLTHTNSIDSMALLFFFCLIVLFDCYPVKVGEIYFTLKSIITLVVFLQFGFGAELILSQIGYFVSIFLTQRMLGLKHLLLHFMFVWMSLFAAMAYHVTQSLFPFVLGGNIPIIAITAYVVTHFFVNHFVLNWTRWTQGLSSFRLDWDNTKWDVLFSILAIPMSILHLLAYQSELGLLGVVIIAIPTAIIAYIFKLSNDVKQANQQMGVIHDLTYSFTSELDIEKSLDALVEAIKKLYSYDTCYIFRYDSDAEELVPLRFDSKESYDVDEMMNYKLNVKDRLGLSAKAVHSGKALYVNHEAGLNRLKNMPEMLGHNRSILAVPLMVKEKVIGVVFLGSYKENGFSKKEVTLIEILANYAATAIENAKLFEQTERRAFVDELTGLYNYRGFEHQLEQQLIEADTTGNPLALLIIDVDYFKEVNDRFGHLMGNRVLQHLATILKEQVRKKDVVTRYGGEEFTIILPDTSKTEAIEIAERIRQAIPAHPIKLKETLQSDQEVFIQNTISMGVAIYPEHAEDGLSLVRHADRAMYVGAKQAGRNRVAVYQAG
jgi:diguanylate cyclase (GGDEF)-like protein